jgi:hypothetical protein
LHYANNYLTIAPRHIMAVGGQSETFQRRLLGAGVTVEWIHLESLIDGYGAAHCMTQVLQREAYHPGVDPADVRSVNALAGESQSSYLLNGTMANENDCGVIIHNGKKVIRK